LSKKDYESQGGKWGNETILAWLLGPAKESEEKSMREGKERRGGKTHWTESLPEKCQSTSGGGEKQIANRTDWK